MINHITTIIFIYAGLSSANAASIATPQGSLSFLATNNRSTIYFEAQTFANDLIITGMSSHLTGWNNRDGANNSLVDLPFIDFEVFTRLLAAGESYADFMDSEAGWNLAATGSGIFNTLFEYTQINLSAPIPLDAGTTHAFALVVPTNSQHLYSLASSNQTYSNADVSLLLGSIGVSPFDGSNFPRRIWNGSLTYQIATSAIPEPSNVMALALLLGSGLMFRNRRRKA